EQADNEAPGDIHDHGSGREAFARKRLNARLEEVAERCAQHCPGNDPGVGHRPVLPCPPWPRSVSSSTSVSSKRTGASRVMTSWAMRSPWRTTWVMPGAVV